jgi:membrane associated rhomboid family serine protease
MQNSDGLVLGLPRPGKALIALMVVVTALWLTFAIGLNWGGAPTSLFWLLAGDTRGVLHGEVWRLVTAPLLHNPFGGKGVSHMITALFGLYFLAPTLEAKWGPARMLRFIALTSALAYLLQMLIELALPPQLGARMVGEQWYGLVPAVTAIAIAWACTFKGQTVRLFMVLPISSRTMILVVIGFGFLRLAAAETPEEGLLAPFGGMFFGWLLGGGTPSPLRKAWLKLRLGQLERAERRGGPSKKPRPNPGGLRVLPGGRADDDDDKGPDGRWLN